MNQPYNPYAGPGAPQMGAPAHTPHQQQQPPQQPQQGGLPTIYMPDEAQIQAAYAKAQEEQARIAAIRSGQGFGGNDARFFSPLGPGGQTKWSGSDVPIGYEASYVFWLCPPWAQGQMPYTEDRSHFYRSAAKPQGSGITCVGNGCWVCAARDMMFKTGREEDAKRARDNGKASRRALYQILLLEHPQSHMTPEGKMTPWVFRAPGGLHDDIVAKLRTKTPLRVMDPQHGRPLILRKKKTGTQTFDVEWSVDDLDPSPLDPWYYPALQNLFDLTKFVKQPTLQDQYDAIAAMGFPVPQELPALVAAEQAQAQMVASGQPGQPMQGQPMQPGQPAYAPGPNAPHANPYPQPGMPSPQGYPAANPGAPGGPPAPGAPGAAPYPPQGQPQPGYPGQPQYAPQPQPGGYQVPGAMPAGTMPAQPAPGGYGAPAAPVDPRLAALQGQMKGQ